MVVVLTGVAGFVGSHLADRLLADGHRVIGIDNLSRGKQAHLSAALSQESFRFLKADLADPEGVPQALYKALEEEGPVDTVWHLAANSDIAAGVADYRIDLRDTFMTTVKALRIAKASGARDFAFASSSAVYGEHTEPLAETHGPLFPISGYGAMKMASEAAISAAVESHLGRAWIYRFPNVVGSRATHGVISDFFHKLRHNPEELEVLGDGTQRKPYLHVSELIDAMLFIRANGGSDRRQIFNIGPEDAGLEVAKIAEAVIAASGLRARLRYTGGDRGWVGDVPRFSYRVDKLARLGWRPSLSSADAVRRAVREVAAERGFA